MGAGRVVYLLEQYAGYTRSGHTGMVGAGVNPKPPIRLSYERLLHSCVDLTPEAVEERLSRYGLSAVLLKMGAGKSDTTSTSLGHQYRRVFI